MTETAAAATTPPSLTTPPDPTAPVGAARPVWSVLGDTPVGPLLLAATDRGLVTVVFHADGPVVRRSLARLAGRLGAEPVPAGEDEGGRAGGAADGRRTVERAARELEAYFRGALREFSVPLDWSLTSGFNGRVLRTLADTVPHGTVVGYRTLAERVGEPGAARAVGVAMGSNPLPVVVPCHRVVESDGGIGGFGGGLETKRTLLALEGVLPAPLF
ncbi:methylated-DNA--[protein]-cysteine S-methyltransferase [Streptomyces sp. TRM43335]|uniref:Methylated-DNA--protein-cysteine methyltransferase n=1 Tax=Streptomyces taklimakanensis TaxID=2569853 RepID=A0A6G2B8V5_9ACTN|nr:methylated-DNA--[protein]-cysteine S-methyltransferase [Streptomyces taklimakanensis]MTE18556.1 methylated-DNA--[protein]-cysteine S-methyltransferase [Streptomyces taklimakanensis]